MDVEKLIEDLEKIKITDIFEQQGYTLRQEGRNYKVEGSSGVKDFSSVTIFPDTNHAYWGAGGIGRLHPVRAYSLLTEGQATLRGKTFIETLKEMDRIFLSGSYEPLPKKPIVKGTGDYTEDLKRFRSMEMQGRHPAEYYHLAMGDKGYQWYDERYGLSRETVNRHQLGQIYSYDSNYHKIVSAASIPYIWHKNNFSPLGDIPPECLYNMQVRLHEAPKEQPDLRYLFYTHGLNSRVPFNLDSIKSHTVPTFIFEGAPKAMKVEQVYREADKPMQAIAGYAKGIFKNMADGWWNIFKPNATNSLTKPIREVFVLLDPDAEKESHEVCERLEKAGIIAYHCYSAIKVDDFFEETFCDSIKSTTDFERSIIKYKTRPFRWAK